MARAKRFGSGERIPAKTVRDTSSATPTYSYDANGNRTNPGDTVGTDNQISTDGTWTYTYDKEGNVTEKTDAAGDKWQYTYDNANELVGATYTPTGTTVASTICTYVYDVFGNKIEQEETVSGTTTITKFAYDGTNVWAAMSSSNALQTRYVYMDGSTTPVAQISSGGTVNWYDTDYEGSVRVVTNNSTGAAVDTITYDAYGNMLSQSAPVSGQFAFYAGGVYDSALGFVLFVDHWYNPVTGSWMQQDVLFPESGTNPYEYGGDDPSNETDPTGLQGITGGVGGSQYGRPGYPSTQGPSQGSAAGNLGIVAPPLVPPPPVLPPETPWQRQQADTLSQWAQSQRRYAQPVPAYPRAEIGPAPGCPEFREAEARAEAARRQRMRDAGYSELYIFGETIFLPGGILDQWVESMAWLGMASEARFNQGAAQAEAGMRAEANRVWPGQQGQGAAPGRQGNPPVPQWTRPPGWRLPKNGTWQGTPGNSNFEPTNPEALGLKPGEVIPFRNGYPDFSAWQRGNPLNVPGLNGNHAHDMPLIYQEVARQQGLPNQTAGQNWLTQQGLTPHHAGGNSVQLIPSELHGGVRHMGGAWELRNQ